MSIELEVLDILTQYRDEHGHLPKFLWVSDDKWQELLDWEPSAKHSEAAPLISGTRVKRVSMLSSGTMMPSPDFGPMDWRSHGERMKNLCFGMEVLR